nr:hypothetical protein [Tanacetum cinerariifolium]
GEFGPFHPAMPTQVPIWLAVALKKRGKCQIRPPDWMSVDFIGALKFEQPQSASDDINDHIYHSDLWEQPIVRSLIEDIKDVRFHKIGTGLEKLSSRTYAMKLNLSAMEVNVIRPFVTGGLETFYKLGNPELIQETERPEHRRTPAADRGPRRELRR